MSTQDNGGSEFPTVDANRDEDYGTRGMTLRDYFAAKAMQSLIMSGQTIQIHTDDGILSIPARKAVPGLAYEYADAMLKARKS